MAKFEKVTFIGIGLIGSSMARRMKQSRMANTIVACARSQKTCDLVLDLGIASEAYLNPSDAVVDADLVVIATPIGSYAEIARSILSSLNKEAILTDVGSVKKEVVRVLRKELKDFSSFIPGHPIAGTEHSGPESGFPELFEGRRTILTPIQDTDPVKLEKISDMWKEMGSSVDFMSPEHHDMVLAITSHLPHLIAYTIVGTATDLEDDLRQEVIKYSASGFRDFTRIAASDPIMWRDIFLNNREATLEVLQRFLEDLSILQRAVRKGEGDKLIKLFERTRNIRRGIIDARQSD